tara:strand:+ start:808 stop:1305 length:498 start_codon:yes stop_codon:yes gene_type:complete
MKFFFSIIFFLFFSLISKSEEIVFECLIDDPLHTGQEGAQKMIVEYNPQKSSAMIKHFSYYGDFNYNQKFNDIGWKKDFEKKTKLSEIFTHSMNHYLTKIPYKYDFSFSGAPNESFSIEGEAMIAFPEWEWVEVDVSFVMKSDSNDDVTDSMLMEGECRYIDIKY